MIKKTPASPRDTFMACVGLRLMGCENRATRLELRRRLVARFRQLAAAGETTHQALRSFVAQQRVESPEELYAKAARFVADHEREGFIGDAFVMAYLVSDVFCVEVVLNGRSFAANNVFDPMYTVELRHEGRRFSLQLPARPGARPAAAPQDGHKTLLTHRYVINGRHPLVPGYRVHTSTPSFDEYVVLDSVDGWEHLRAGERFYVFDFKFNLVACTSGLVSPRFYNLSKKTIYGVVARSAQEARQCVVMEQQQQQQ